MQSEYSRTVTGFDLLSDRPENSADNRGDSDVNALLPDEPSRRWKDHTYTTAVPEPLLSYPIIR